MGIFIYGVATNTGKNFFTHENRRDFYLGGYTGHDGSAYVDLWVIGANEQGALWLAEKSGTEKTKTQAQALLKAADDLGRTELECPECGKEIEVTTMSRPRRGRKPGSTNAAPLTNPIPPKAKDKDDELDIENLDLDNNEDQVEDDTVLLEDETDIDPALDAGVKPPEEGEEEY